MWIGSPIADQVDSFMRDGYLRIEGAFSREKAAEWTQDVWTRLGMDPNDPSTWTEEWTNMPCEWASNSRTRLHVVEEEAAG
jgi:hypothetical protein